MNRENVEAVFFNVLRDMRGYLPDLTLVGGWMPYVYSHFLWKTSVRNPVTTVDVDFGVDHNVISNYSKTIYETLSSLNYNERHLKINRMAPVVLCQGKVPVEFITYPAADMTSIEAMVGPQTHINRMANFDFLLNHRVLIKIETRKKDASLMVHCPRLSAFSYHK